MQMQLPFGKMIHDANKEIRMAETAAMSASFEEWMDVDDLPGYMVSSFGVVKSIRYNKTLSHYPDQKGYPQVSMSFKNKRVVKRVHLLVAKAFLPNPTHLPVVNHIDGNNKNPRACNLEWTSYKGNTQHAVITGLKVPKNRVQVQVFRNDEVFGNFQSFREAAEALKVPIGCIPYIIKGNSKKYAYLSIKKV
jgi:hypothetical protein